MDEIQQKLAILEQKVDAVYESAEKTRKYFLWTLIITVLMFLLPLIGLMIAIPFLLNTMGQVYGGLL